MALSPETPPHPDAQALFDYLQRQQAQQLSALPPVAQWQPPLSGDMDMRIARDGSWYHRGGAIRRPAMVKLFSRILKREGDDYFLVTPVEKWRIVVEDAPFVAVDFRLEAGNSAGECAPMAGQALIFTTQVGDEVVLGPENPLWVEQRENVATGSGEPRPYISVRAGLKALLHRNIYYRLVEFGLNQREAPLPDTPGDGKRRSHDIGVWSLGQFFTLEPTALCGPPKPV